MIKKIAIILGILVVTGTVAFFAVASNNNKSADNNKSVDTLSEERINSVIDKIMVRDMSEFNSLSAADKQIVVQTIVDRDIYPDPDLFPDNDPYPTPEEIESGT
jgi:hypothetical protein